MRDLKTKQMSRHKKRSSPPKLSPNNSTPLIRVFAITFVCFLRIFSSLFPFLFHGLVWNFLMDVALRDLRITIKKMKTHDQPCIKIEQLVLLAPTDFENRCMGLENFQLNRIQSKQAKRLRVSRHGTSENPIRKKMKIQMFCFARPRRGGIS